MSTQPGGGPQHVLTLATWLKGRGLRPIVAAPRDGAMFERFLAAGIETVEVSTNRVRPTALLTLAHVVRKHGVRLVHSHGKGAGLYGRLIARAHRIPAVHTFHGIHYERYSRFGRAMYLMVERRLSRWTTIVVNVSREQEAEGLALALFTPAQSRVVVNGVDVRGLAATALERREARAVLGLGATVPVVGCAARFDEVKGLDLLLEAVASVPDERVTAVLIGRGAEERRLRELAAARGLGTRAVFPGEIADAARLFPAFDVFAAPSRKEGLPLAVLEAMALGIPVVASDIPAHREVLGPITTALVERRPAAFAAALSRLLGDEAERRALAGVLRTRARSEFDARQMLSAIEAIYRQLLDVL